MNKENEVPFMELKDIESAIWFNVQEPIPACTMVQNFLNKYKDMSIPLLHDGTLLNIACLTKRCSFDMVKLLVDSGRFDIHETDGVGYTALARACMNFNLPIVQYLVEHGADPVNGCSRLRRNVLTMVAGTYVNLSLDQQTTGINRQALEVLRYLCSLPQYPVLASAIDKFNYTAYENVAGVDFPHMAWREAMIIMKNVSGGSPLHYACQVPNYSMMHMKMLVERFPIDEHNHDGYTPLMIACANRHLKIVHYLVMKGANVAGALDLVSKMQWEEGARLLMAQ